ncbi:hypothetical protein CA233_22575 [Sphingomonas sp. ABOLD]|uniref:Uncharacterized protein n=1 Tax=Sphingomonas trueperi TaxID=53317 RepID=A0A7X6BE35_9SPHN|nr:MULTISPECIES: hypothetical protein [Sphingomonas]NJB98521.1 hypothetical protein [Sphingomonas trueperi]RSV36676.1 hypothetical protein CA233_22575 [Sphingomonas sp. ABOLD]RSV40832.1 hypothetical protein CA234_10445 [Sphingomonas sp. ABOLE]
MPTKSVILFESTLGRMLRSARGGAVHDSLDAIPLTWSANMPDPVREALLQRPVLNNQVQLLLAEEVRRIVLTRIGPMVGPHTVESGNIRNAVERLMLAELPVLQRRVNDVIAASLKTSAAWDAYRVDSKKEVARVGLTLIFLAAGVAAAPPTGGASLVLAVISTVRGLTDAVKKFTETYRSAEESRERVLLEIRKLREMYQKSPALGRTVQLGGAVAHALTIGKMLALGQHDFLPGFARIKTELNAYKGKVGHLGEHSERLARKLYDMIEEIDAHIDAHGEETASGARLVALRNKVTALLEFGVTGRRHGLRGTFTITEAWQKCQREMAQIAAVERAFSDLKALDSREKAVLLADRALTLLTNAGVGAASYNAAMALPHAAGSGAVEDALRLTQSGQPSGGGIAAFSLGFMRQFMSLFKDAHALAKELGIVNAASTDISAEAKAIEASFNGLLAQPPEPRLPSATLAEASRARRPLPPPPLGRDKALPPLPTMTSSHSASSLQPPAHTYPPRLNATSSPIDRPLPPRPRR